jgi:hypothetical protein
MKNHITPETESHEGPTKPNITGILTILLDCLKISNIIDTVDIKKYEKAIKNIFDDTTCNNNGFEIQDIFNDFKYVINSKAYFEYNRNQILKEVESYQDFCRRCVYEHDFYIDSDTYFDWFKRVIREGESIDSILTDIQSVEIPKANGKGKLDGRGEGRGDGRQTEYMDDSEKKPAFKQMSAEQIYTKMSQEIEELKIVFKETVERNEHQFKEALETNRKDFHKMLEQSQKDNQRQFINLNRKIVFQEKQIETISEYLIIGFIRETVSYIIEPLWQLMGKNDLNINNIEENQLYLLLEQFYPSVKRFIELMIQIKYEGNDIIHLTKHVGNRHDLPFNVNKIDSFTKFTEEFIAERKYNLGKFGDVDITEMKEFCKLINGGNFLNFKKRVVVNDLKTRLQERAKEGGFVDKFGGLFIEWEKREKDK